MEQNKDIRSVHVAIIDMNNGQPNQGMRGIQEILSRFSQDTGIPFKIKIFSLRDKQEIPGLDYDIYISSGGPGSPYDGNGAQWEKDFFELLDNLDRYNQTDEPKKFTFLICHSFQLACMHYGLGKVTNRRSTAFGIFPIHLTPAGQADPVFKGLKEAFYSVDSRDWQVIEPDEDALKSRSAQVLAIEKERPHVHLERCVMAIRFSPYTFGTQFHPEADPEGMKMYLLLQEKKDLIISAHGQAKYEDMLHSLDEPDRITLTQKIILPNFLMEATEALRA